MKKCNVPEDMQEGVVHSTKNYGDLEIVEWCNARDVKVKFLGYDHIVTTQSSHIRRGSVKNVMLPTMAGVGYIGLGNYSQAKHLDAYTAWNSMLQRCYNKKYQEKHPSYVDCYVCDEWCNFQNFAKWFYDVSNYEAGLYLDKDIICQGNKEYAPDKCSFVTAETNAVTTSCMRARGEYMLGANWAEDRKKFRAASNDGNGNLVQLGSYGTELEAHEAYKAHKYDVLEALADKQTDPRVAQGLRNWIIPKY